MSSKISRPNGWFLTKEDDYLIALARVSGADFLVSGDPRLHGLEGENMPEVLTPRQFWSRLEREQGAGEQDQPGSSTSTA